MSLANAAFLSLSFSLHHLQLNSAEISFYGHAAELNNNNSIYDSHLITSPGNSSPNGLDQKPNLDTLGSSVEMLLSQPTPKRVKLYPSNRGEHLILLDAFRII